MMTVSPAARAAALSLSDANSRIDINFADPVVNQEWTVDGTTISGESGLWYGYNHPGGPNSITSIQQTAANRIDLSWYFLGLGAGATYQLDGGGAGSGEATLTESFWVLNALPGATPFKTFDYNHYNLSNGTMSGDQARMLDPSTLLQTGSVASLSVFSDLRPAHYSIDVPADLLGHVSDITTVGSPLDLDDMPVLGTSAGGQAGSPAFAFQWNPSLGPYETRTFSTVTKHLTLNRNTSVPEPGSLALLAAASLAGIGTSWRRSRRQKPKP
jgi:hypothetical protein